MDERFKRHWDTWHTLRAEGKTPAEFLQTASDETLVELLAYTAEGTEVERNVIATELTNRLTRLHKRIASHGDEMDTLLGENTAALAEAGRADERMKEGTAAFRADTEKTSRYAKGAKERKGGW